MRLTARAPLYLTIFLLSVSTLAWEIVLSRVFAITQFYHFAFLAVNVALLGFGISGTVLSLRPSWTQTDPSTPGARPALMRRLEGTAIAYTIALLGSYFFVNTLPLDSYAIAWDRRQLWLLVAYYLALTAPFLFTGLAVGMALAMTPQRSNRVYAANLLGSAIGALSAPLLLMLLGIPGVVFGVALLGLLAATITRLPIQTSTRRFRAGLLYLPILLLLAITALIPPAGTELNLSLYKGLPQALNYPGARVIARADSPIARVEIIESEGVRSLPGLSFQYRGLLPPQYGLLTDGDDLNPVLDAGQAIDWRFLDYLPEALAFALTDETPALILKPQGGLSIWQALDGGSSARPVTAIEANPAVVQEIDRLLGPASPYRQEQVETVVEDARSYLRRDQRRYGVIDLALTQPYRPVTSGAYSLGEDYDLTLEAFDAYLDHLSPDGILVLSRWLQTPPSESLRTLALLVEGLRRRRIEDPAAHIVALRGLQTAIFYVKLSPWSPAELAAMRDFARSRRFDLALAPDLDPAEINQFNILPEPYYEEVYQALLAAPDPQAFLAAQPFAVQPPSDDHPFFFHFFKWSQTPTVLRTLGQTWQPFGGSGILVLVALLALAILASVILIVLPLLLRRLVRSSEEKGGVGVTALWRVLVYFGALGLGFLLVEAPLIQRFILFLGHPTLALAAVLAGVLFWSGLGSLLAPRVPWRTGLLALLAVLIAYILFLGSAFDLLLGASTAVRFPAALLLIAPLGLLMGMPFPNGLRWLTGANTGLTAWAWAINGCASVIASVLAALLALQWGFGVVLLAGTGCYALAAVVARKA